MFFSRPGSLCCAYAAVLFCSRAALADSGPENGPGATVTSPAAASIVLVGEMGENEELRELLVEFLERKAVQSRFVRQPEFRRQELLAASKDDSVHVFVVPAAGRARLYFRGPDGQRFLLREVELRNGLDEVGRELIGQIVESSVDALLHSAAGITREEVQSELEKQAPEPAPAPAAPERSEPTERALPAAIAPRSELEAWCALRYAAEFAGDPGLGHGPGLELGIGARRGLLLRGRVFGERWFPQSVQGNTIGADIVATRARLALDLGFELGSAATLILSLGAGADLVRVEPGRARDPSVVPAATSESAVPAARGELRLEFGGDVWQLAFAVSADSSLADTHYDVTAGSTVQRVAEEWAVRPGTAVAIGWRPRF